EIQKQGYNFIYGKEQLENTKKVNVEVVNEKIEKVLEICFRDQPITYTIEDKYIVVKKRDLSLVEKIQNSDLLIDVKGKVTDEKGEPLIGATVSVNGTNKAIPTNERGEFTLAAVNDNATLVISNVGYETQKVSVKNGVILNIRLIKAINNLDETVV